MIGQCSLLFYTCVPQNGQIRPEIPKPLETAGCRGPWSEALPFTRLLLHLRNPFTFAVDNKASPAQLYANIQKYRWSKSTPQHLCMCGTTQDQSEIMNAWLRTRMKTRSLHWQHPFSRSLEFCKELRPSAISTNRRRSSMQQQPSAHHFLERKV